MAKATSRPGAAAGLGGFGALFDLKQAGFHDPVLVATTDGVGTKLRLATQMGKHDTIGVDLVAMCVNDLVVQGAEPLFFLDYFATGRLEVDTAREVVAGIAEGCRTAACSLIGGETAEMPGMYAPGDYDLAGFAVGAFERGRGLDGSTVAAGDIVLGMASDGLHSNGFSLVRKVVEELDLPLDAPAPFDTARSLGEALLTPTRIYTPACLAALRQGRIKALAHITGGGLPENLPRALPADLGAEIEARALPCLPVFDWLAREGGIATSEMLRTFNCGIGMAAVVAPEEGDEARALLQSEGESVHRIGRIVSASDDGSRVMVENQEAIWGA